MSSVASAEQLEQIEVAIELPLSELTHEILSQRRAVDAPLRRGWLVRRMLLFADLFGLIAAFVVASALAGVPGADRVTTMHEALLLAVTLPGWVLLAKLYGLYDRDEERTDHSTVDDVMGVFHLVTVGVWVLYLVASQSSLANPPLARFVLFWALAVGLITAGRVTARTACRRSIAYLQNTIIVGAGDVGQLTAKKVLQHPEYGINLVGFVDSQPKQRRDDIGHLAILGDSAKLPELISLLDVERVIVAFSNDSHEETLALIRALKDHDVQIDIVPRLFEVLGRKTPMHDVEGIPLVSLRPLRLSRSSRLVKRLFDVGLTAVGLVLVAPLLLVAACLIKLDSPGPVFFRQVRRGGGESTFRIFKFRTMAVNADARKTEVAHLNMHADTDPRMFKIPDDPRVTRVGRFLRRTSIDELPQLLNVLRGEMSLVGPRPLILEEDQNVAKWARRRLDLKPGITGLWQVLGRSDIPFEEMTRLDYLYVTNWSLAEDLRLICRTAPALLRSRRAF